MFIYEESGDGVLTVKPQERLDTLTSPEIDKFLADKYGAFRQIVFDLEKVDYISSAGLRLLVQAHKNMKDKGGVLMRHVCPQVIETLTLTGYVHVLKIE